MKSAGHTSIPKHKMAIVFMRDGTKLIGKFLKSEDKHIWIEGHAPIRKNQIRTISVYKPI